MINLKRLQRAIVVLALVAAGLAVSAENAFATHFRYGTITWTTPNPAQPNVIQVRFDAAWRWSYPWGLPANPVIGNVIVPGSLEILNSTGTATVASAQQINAIVTGVDQAQDWISTSFVTTVTLPAGVPADYLLRFTGCCRVSTIADNNHDQNYTVLSRVSVRNPVNRPPVSASLPIVSVGLGQPVNFTVPAFDPDGDPLSYSLSPLADSGLLIQAPAGTPAMTINTSTGRVTWTPNLLGLFSVQFTVFDSRGASTVIDILFQVVSVAVGSPPVVRINSVAAPATFNVLRGTLLNFNVLGTDPDNTPVTLSSSTLPSGATMIPSLPTQANGNVSSTFNWVPSPAQVGSYIVTYAVLDGSGQQATQNVQINVTNNPPTLVCNPSGSTIEATGPSGATFSISGTVNDVDHDSLVYQVFIDNVLRSSSGNVSPPATIPFSTPAALGNHTYQLRVTDNFSPTVTCSGNFAIVDTTAPSVNVPADITLIATSSSGAVATFSATATDAVDTSPTILCTPPSGSTFPLGTTTVTCTATDDSGNANSGSFTVTVNQAATSLTTPTVPATALVGSPVTATATLTRTSAPVGPLGSQVVTFTVTRPDGSVTTLNSTTDSLGLASTAIPTIMRGVYSVSVSYAGTPALQASSSASASFAVYQRTSLTMVDPIHAVAGDPVTVSATLNALPQNTPVAGQSVTFSFAMSGVGPVSGVTDVNGVASVNVVFPLPTTDASNATFSNAADFFVDDFGTIPPVATIVRGLVVVDPVVASLTHSAPAVALVADSLSVSASLNRATAPAGPLGNQLLTFTLSGPAPATMTALTDSTGAASASFPLSVRGAYSVSVSYAGTAAITAAASAPTTVNVYQRTTLALSNTSGVAGAPTSFSAQLLTAPQGAGLSGQQVQFAAGPFTATGVTDGSGLATASITFPAAGTFTVTATFYNSDFYTDQNGSNPAVATVAAASVVITKAATAVAPLGLASTQFVGDSMPVQTVLTRTSAPAGPETGATLAFSLTGASSNSASGLTDGIGQASTAFNLGVRGLHNVSASFAGSQALDGSSTSQDITVYQKTLVSLSNAGGIAGSAITLTATLVSLPANVPMGGQSIVFSFGGVIPDQVATTDGSGVASVTVVFPSVGTFSATASFTNVADFFANHTGALAAETSSASVTVTDSTAPVVTPTISGTLGANGWYTSDVAVSWSVTDPETAVSSQVGCGPSTITTDGAAFTLTCTATSGGGTTTETVTIKRDATAPALSATSNITMVATSATGATVNYTSPTATDGLSGVASSTCAPPAGFFPLGTTTVICSATDNAGNSTTSSFTVTVTDPTPPVIVSTITGTLGANGWYTSDVTVSWSVTDLDSGIASSTGCTTSTTTTDGASFTKTCTATSAGGTATKSVTFKRDASAPTITVSPNKTDDADSWDGTDVTYAAATATDPTSGIASVVCTPASGSTFPIGVTTVSCVATNNAGLTKTGTFTVTIVDRGEPGKMFGNGETAGPNNHEIEFKFSVLENRRGNEWGDVDIKVRDTRRRRGDDERFDAQTVDDVFFSNAPDYGPGHNSRTGIDTVIFRGTGKWDGRSGYTYVVTSSDRGEPGRGRDTFTIEIKSPTGAVVFTGGGTLTDGNVQSSRGWRSWSWWNGHHNNSWRR